MDTQDKQAQAQSGEWVMVPKDPTKALIEEWHAFLVWRNLAESPSPQVTNIQQALVVLENAALSGFTLSCDDIPRLQATVDRIAPQPAQDAKDAARYRWLREHHDSTRPDWHVRTPTNDAPAIGGLDAAIDAAMAKERPNG